MSQNILLVTIDSLRYDSAPPNEKTGGSTLATLQSSGVSFTHAFATGPGTTPSFPALLTGTLPLSHGGLGPLNDSRPRLSSHLRKSGFRTGGFQCNPFLSRPFNYHEGYDKFEDYQNPLMGIATKIFPRGIEINNPKLRRVDDFLHLTDVIKKSYQFVKGKPRPYVSAEVITDDTVGWLDATDETFFCWTHYMDVHHPCFPPAEYLNRYDMGNVTQSEVSEWYSALLQEPMMLTDAEIKKLETLYEAALNYTDDQIGRIIDYLKDTGRYDDTLIIITSDHGELFGEYGQYGKPERMYDELLHVPLIVTNGPDYLTNVQDDLISLLDIPPLIHDVLRVKIPDVYEGRIPGVDTERDVVMAEHEVEGAVVVGARSGNWLFEADKIHDEHRLFDLRNGGFERVDPTQETPGAVTVRNAVHERLNQLDVEANHLPANIEGDVKGRLEDLGYM